MHLQVHLKSRAVRLSTGVTLRYVEQGHHSGVPVLLLHAYVDSWRSFERVLEHLPDDLHALAPSQRGEGPTRISKACAQYRGQSSGSSMETLTSD